MANESVVVSFKNGLKTNLNSATKVAGQVLFALNNDTGTGSIYYDKDTTHRFRMSYDLKDITNTIPESATSITTVANRTYPVALDQDGYLAVNVPWSSIALDLGTGLDQQGTTINNTGVITVATGTANGTLSVKTGSANAVDVAVKGLQNIAYVAYPDTDATTKYLRGDGSWQVPPDTQYYNGSGLTLTGTTFSIENGEITNAMLANSSMSIAGNTVSLGGTLTASTLRTSLGLSNALHFIGKATVGISDGGTEDPVISGYNASTDRQAGDVVLSSDGNMEYVWSTTGAWEALGPEWLTVSTTTGTAIEFVTDFNYNGAVINLEKSVVRTASTSQSGVITINDTTTNSLLNTLSVSSSNPVSTDYYISQYAGGGTTTTTYHRRPLSALWNYIKSEADNVYAFPSDITSAINALDASDTEVTGEYIAEIIESDGIISISRTAFSPSISITAGTSSDGPKVNVTVNTKSGTAQEITKASTSAYGVTKLTSAASNVEESLAATPKGVQAAIDAVKYKVTQIGDNENKEFPILLKYTDTTTDETGTVKYNNSVYHQTTINPSTGVISSSAVKVDALHIPTTNGGSSYGVGSSGQYLRTNGTSAYWGSIADTGSATQGVYFSGGEPVALSYALQASVNSGVANSLTYYSGVNSIANANNSSGGLKYYTGNSSATTPAAYTRLHIYGPTIGNTAENMISGTAGLFSFGDAGPQITFDVSSTPGSGQAGALIYTDHDTAGVGASWHFVSNQTDWNVTSKRFHARTSISIGQNLPNTSYNLYVNGTSYHNGETTVNGNLLKVTNNSNTISIGSQNASYAHIENSASIPFLFNKSILSNGSNNLGDTTFPWQSLYITGNIYYKGGAGAQAILGFYPNSSSTNYGVIIGGKGALVLGSGTNGGDISTITGSNRLNISASTKNTYVISDDMIYLEAGSATIGNRAGISISTTAVTPIKAEGVNNQALTLGSSTSRWSAVYVGDSATKGSATKPIYWNNGVPAEITSYSGTADKALADGSGHNIEDTYLAKTGGSVSGNITMTGTAKFVGDLQGSATSASTATNATNATNDQNGTNIASTYLKKSGGDMTGTLKLKGLKGTASTDYGETLPASPAEGQIFFQLSSEQYELPAGGATGTLLMKKSASNYDVQWTPAAVYVSGSVLYGAAWNDYAEFRSTIGKIEPGRVVIENGDDTLSLSTERLQGGAEIVSDTFGFAIGQTEKCNTPIAASGRVLAYPNEPRDTYKPGQPVCSGPNGTVSQMTDEEARNYPWLIIGTVSAIPDYKTWGEDNIEVKERIWVRIR